MNKPTLEERFWSKVVKSEACWTWTASKTLDGYGLIKVDGSLKRAHRLSYEWSNGAIPDGLVIDHLCHSSSCVRPDHLRAVTTKQNAENRRGAQVDNTSCGVRGVCRSRNKWQAQIRHHGKRKYLGVFDTVEEAEAAVIEARNRYFTHNDADRVKA